MEGLANPLAPGMTWSNCIKSELLGNVADPVRASFDWTKPSNALMVASLSVVGMK